MTALENTIKTPAYVSEEQVELLLNNQNVLTVVEQAFAAMFKKTARNFPVVRERLGFKGALYGFKSGFDEEQQILGLKAGGYWAHNLENGIACHQSTVVLFDPATGQLKALVSGNRLTALRTAAASAASIKYLARKDAKVLGIIGAGGQAIFQLQAAMEQRTFTKVMIASRTRESSEKLAADIANFNVEVVVSNMENVARSADVLITILSSWEPQVQSEWIQPGTHVACMGSDTKGKQEVEAALVGRADAFTDQIEQSITIGECQHAYASGLIDKNSITPIGQVIAGEHLGRSSDTSITVFDSTGVGLQDLVAADLVLNLLNESE
jgi:ornithine cyclodeaminase